MLNIKNVINTYLILDFSFPLFTVECSFLQKNNWGNLQSLINLPQVTILGDREPPTKKNIDSGLCFYAAS